MTPARRRLERLSRVTPLGVRFWDDATGAVVADGLDVEVHPSDQPQRRGLARPNRIGTYVLPALPGQRDPDVHFGDGGDEFWSRVVRRDHVISVADRGEQFVPFTMTIPLPAKGLAVSADVPPQSPPVDVVTLYSASARRVPAGLAVLRAELHTRVRNDRGELIEVPASWAVLDAHIAGHPPARGIADREGRVMILFPYPEPLATPPRPASPPFPSGQALTNQEWPVRLEAFFEPQRIVPDVPELGRTLRQAPAFLWADGNASWPLPTQTLRYGQELIVRRRAAVGQRGEPAVIVTPSVSPP